VPAVVSIGMRGSPYRRGAPFLLAGAGFVLLPALVLGWVSTLELDPAPAQAARRDRGAAAAGPSPPAPTPHAVEVPVETDPPGASVYRVDDGRRDLICFATPCRFFVDRFAAEGIVVSLELPGHATAQMHVKDVVDVPGSTMMLTFGPPEPRDPSYASPRPKLRQGRVEVTGDLPPEVVSRIVRQSFGRFRLCYEQGLLHDPMLRGRVAVKIAIAHDGAASSAEDAGSEMPNREVLACVVRSFGSLSFPSPTVGTASVVFPLLFDPGA
jgi:hypothetical protein